MKNKESKAFLGQSWEKIESKVKRMRERDISSKLCKNIKLKAHLALDPFLSLLHKSVGTKTK